MSNKGGITFELTTNVKAVDQKIEAALRKALDRIAIKWSAEAKKAAPVDTGRLRASIAFSTPNVNALHTENYKDGVVQYQPPATQGLTVQVGSNVEYALQVHEGLPGEMASREGGRTVRRSSPKRKPNKFIEEPGRLYNQTFQKMVTEEVTKASR